MKTGKYFKSCSEMPKNKDLVENEDQKSVVSDLERERQVTLDRINQEQKASKRKLVDKNESCSSADLILDDSSDILEHLKNQAKSTTDDIPVETASEHVKPETNQKISAEPIVRRKLIRRK